MKKKPKTDANQSDIVKAIRKAGGSVQILAAVGAGCPDLLVGWKGLNILLEIKSEKGKLTPDQQVWWREWLGGRPFIIRSPYEGIKLLNFLTYIKGEHEKHINSFLSRSGNGSGTRGGKAAG